MVQDKLTQNDVENDYRQRQEYAASILASDSSKSTSDLMSDMSEADLCKPKFKSCNVVLLPDYEGYGFKLNSKIKPKYTIYTIDPNSPAYKANLRESDVIVQIDKKNIRRQKFDKIKQMLSDSQKKGGVEILAIDREGYMYYKNRKKRFSSNKLVTVENTEHFWNVESVISSQTDTGLLVPHTLNNDTESNILYEVLNKLTIRNDTIISTERHPKKDSISHADLPANSVLPRLCRLKRDNATSQYGFDFKTLKGEGTHVANNVREGLPAAQAGLREGDYILEVNGESVHGVEHDVVISKIKAHVTMVDLLAVNDAASYNAYRQQMKRPDKADVAIELSKEGEVTHHKLVPVPGFKGLGIRLNSSGVITAVDAGSPAVKAGLKKDMKIVEVNEKNVQSKTYIEIAKAIKENEKNLSIGVIDMPPLSEFVGQVRSAIKLSKEPSVDSLDDYKLSSPKISRIYPNLSHISRITVDSQADTRLLVPHTLNNDTESNILNESGRN